MFMHFLSLLLLALAALREPRFFFLIRRSSTEIKCGSGDNLPLALRRHRPVSGHQSLNRILPFLTTKKKKPS
jgi:hypothetical protein